MQVVARRAEQAQLAPFPRLMPAWRHFDAAPSGEIGAGQRALFGHQGARIALRHDPAAVHAGPRSDIDQVIRRANGVFVVFDDQHRVAQVAQVGQGFQQALVISLVQTDGGFVEDVHHTDQSGADLRRQANALRFTAGQGLGAALQGQIVQAHVDEKAVAGADFLEDFFRDPRIAPLQVQGLEILHGLAHRQRRNGGQIAPVDQHVTRVFAQAAARAGRAGRGGQELRQVFAHGLRFRVPIAPLHVGNDALEGMRAFEHVAALVEIRKADLFPAAAVQNELAVFGREFCKRRVDVEAAVPGQRREHVKIVHVAPIPAAYRARREAGFGMHDNALRVEELAHAKPVANGAGAGRVVEGEQTRLQFADAVPALRAREARGEDHIRHRRIHIDDQRQAVAQFKGRLEGFGEAQFEVFADFEAVHHDFDRMLFPFVEIRQIVQFAHHSIHPGAHKAGAAQLFEYVQVLSLALANKRREQHQATAPGQGQHAVHHLADGLRLEAPMVCGAVRFADPGEEQAQVVVNLRNGAHGGARVVRGGFLFDGNRRRQTFDVIDIRFLHHRQELPGVGRERFHVAALALGVQRVEGQ